MIAVLSISSDLADGWICTFPAAAEPQGAGEAVLEQIDAVLYAVERIPLLKFATPEEEILTATAGVLPTTMLTAAPDLFTIFESPLVPKRNGPALEELLSISVPCSPDGHDGSPRSHIAEPVEALPAAMPNLRITCMM